MTDPEPLSTRGRAAAAAILLLATILRLLDIRFHPYTPDQMFSVGLANLGWGEMIRATAADTHPPLYYALLKLWYLITPPTLGSAQVLSVLISIWTLWLLFRLARHLFSPAAAWFALLFAALAPYQVYWSHAARMHQLLAPAITLVLLVTWRWIDRPSRPRWWLLAAAWFLAIQTNYLGLVALAVWTVAFGLGEPALPWRRRLILLAAPLPGVLSFLAWISILLRQVAHGPMNAGFFQETVSPIYLYYHAVFGQMVPYQPNQAGPLFLLFMLLFTAVFIAAGFAIGRRWSLWILLLGLPTVPILIVWAFGFTLAERHLWFTLPLFMACWGAGCIELPRRLRRKLPARA